MVSGAVTVQFVDPDVISISNAIAAVRFAENDKWMMTTMAHGQQIIIAHIEEEGTL